MDLCYYDLNDEKIIGTFYEKELQITNQEEFKIKKVIKKKRKQAICQMEKIHLIAGLIKKT